MSVKSTSVTINSIIRNNRFEANFWIIGNYLDNVLSNFNSLPITNFTSSIKKGIFDLKAESYQEFGVPFLRISNLKYFELSEDSLVFISESDNEINHKTILRHGDIAMSKIGTLGKLYRVGLDYNCVNISQNIIGLTLKENVNKNYIFLFLLSKLALYQLDRNKKRQLQDKLNLEDIKRLEVPIIKEEYQKLLSSKVYHIEDLILNSNNLLQQSQNFFYEKLGINFKQIKGNNSFSANFSELINANLWTPKYFYPLYKNTLQSICKKWQTVTIGEIAILNKGDEVGSDHYINYIDKRHDAVPFIRTSDIVNFELDIFPDYYIEEEIYKELAQGIQHGEVLFTKDGKIGIVGMITQSDRAIISSGISRIQLTKNAEKYNITPEYLFIALSIKEIGYFASKRRTVVASTIPHLREERLKEIEIPILDKEDILKITELVRHAFVLKDKKKQLFHEVRNEIDNYFSM